MWSNRLHDIVLQGAVRPTSITCRSREAGPSSNEKWTPFLNDSFMLARIHRLLYADPSPRFFLSFRPNLATSQDHLLAKPQYDYLQVYPLQLPS